MTKFKLNENEIGFLIYKVESESKNINEILKEARKLNGINFQDIAYLLNINPNENHSDFIKLLSTAKDIRKDALGSQINLLVPLYMTNFCVNKCPYCAFHDNQNNHKSSRIRLSFEQFCKEIDYLTENKNFKTIELVFSDDPEIDPKEIAEHIKYLKNHFVKKKGGMTCLNSPPLSQKEYSLLKSAGLDVVVSWQETYHKETYETLHKECISKKNYEYRLGTQERIYSSGIKHVGIGLLFGLYDFRFETMSLVKHALFLKEEFNYFPIIGIPRLKNAKRMIFSPNPKYSVSDDQLKLITAIIRLALPFSHIFISTRENKDMMMNLLETGGGNITAALCNVSPGYQITSKKKELSQFDVFSYEPNEMKDCLLEKGCSLTFNPPFFDHIRLERLITSIIEGDVVLFIGSGLSRVIKDKSPVGSELSRILLEKLNLPSSGKEPLPKISHIFEKRFGRDELIKILRDLYDFGGTSPIHEKIANVLNIKTFITTNYDRMLEDTIKERRLSINIIREENDMLKMESETTIFKIHGSFESTNRERDNIIVTDEDFDNYEKENPLIYNKLEELFFTKTILFIGYSVEDRDITTLIRRTNRRLKKHTRFFAVMRNPTDVESEFFEANNFVIFNIEIESFLDLLTEKLRTDYKENSYTFERLWEVRKQLEIGSVRLAAKYRENRDIEDLKNILANFEIAIEQQESKDILWKQDFAFHKRIAIASQSIFFYDICRTLYKSLIPLSRQVQSFDTLRQHYDILRAIIDKDENKAMELMEDHIDFVRVGWQKSLK